LDLSDCKSNILVIQNWRQEGSSIDGTEFLGLVSGVRITFERFSVDHGRTSPAALPSIRCAPCSCRERRGSWSEPIDPAEDLGEQGARHRYLGQLEHDVATVAHDPGADLDQLLAQRGQRPMLDPLRQANVCRKLARL
jgi:hypothetical protein